MRRRQPAATGTQGTPPQLGLASRGEEDRALLHKDPIGSPRSNHAAERKLSAAAKAWCREQETVLSFVRTGR